LKHLRVLDAYGALAGFSAERCLAASCEFVLAARVRAWLPGHQLKMAAILVVVVADVLRVPMIEHPCD
jgi:hypothetical protein